MKRTLLLPALLLIAVAVIPLAHSFASPQADEPVAPVSIFFVRHAETAASTRTNRDPELSEQGIARSKALAQLLQNSGVTHLFASEYQRTQSTLAELAKQCGLEVKILAASEMKNQLATLQSLPAGSVAVVCGHSNTVPAMVAGLGGKINDLEGLPTSRQVLDHGAYNRLFLMVLAASDETAPKTIELCYGTAKVVASTD